MLFPELERELEESKKSLHKANRDNIVEQCKRYLNLLEQYRSRLYNLKMTTGAPQTPNSTTTLEETPDRKAVREAIEETTRERNTTQVLLLSFTTVSGYEAVEIFNERKYQGHDDWELRASGVKFHGGETLDLMTIQEAVQLASVLRREDYVARNA
jgi:hypothetical protein